MNIQLWRNDKEQGKVIMQGTYFKQIHKKGRMQNRIIILLFLVAFGSCQPKINPRVFASGVFCNRVDALDTSKTSVELYITKGVIAKDDEIQLIYREKGRKKKCQVYGAKGNIKRECFYGDDQSLTGPYTSYFDNGKLHWSAHLIKYRYNGLYTEYGKSGEILCMYIYKDNVIANVLYAKSEGYRRDSTWIPWLFIVSPTVNEK